MPQEIAIKNLIFVDCEGHGPAPTLNDPVSFEFGAVAYPSKQTFHGTGATKETREGSVIFTPDLSATSLMGVHGKNCELPLIITIQSTMRWAISKRSRECEKAKDKYENKRFAKIR